MKSEGKTLDSVTVRSLPLRGAWIEIIDTNSEKTNVSKSLPLRGAWIEMGSQSNKWNWGMSLPLRGAWIEIIDTNSEKTNVSKSLPLRGAWIEIVVKQFRPVVL